MRIETIGDGIAYWKEKLMQAIMFISFSADLDLKTFTLSDFDTDVSELYQMGCQSTQTLPQAYNTLTETEVTHG